MPLPAWLAVRPLLALARKWLEILNIFLQRQIINRMGAKLSLTPSWFCLKSQNVIESEHFAMTMINHTGKRWGKRNRNTAQTPISAQTVASKNKMQLN